MVKKRQFFIVPPLREISYQICLKSDDLGAPGSGCRAATELTLLAYGSAALQGGPQTPAEGDQPSALPLLK